MTSTSRRTVLAAGAAAVVAAAVPVLPAEAAPVVPVARGVARLYRRKRFAPRVGTLFELAGKGGRWRARLVGVTDLPGARAGDERCFGLTFAFTGRGPGQGTYLLRRKGFTETELFVVPVDAERGTVQAVVNSL